jgi:hypothetical protein
MTALPKLDPALLERFERGLNLRAPQASPIPARVLGVGEISTALEIEASPGMALKRMPMFRDAGEADRYEKLYEEYIAVLGQQAGLTLPESSILRVMGHPVVLYILQEKLPEDSIGNRAIQHMPPEQVHILVSAVLSEMQKVFAFNRQNRGRIEIGLDGQISNWSIQGYDPAQPLQSGSISLKYIDTSTPLMRKNGVEQLDSELFLRSAPSFLRWLLRALFVSDVVNRYYYEHKIIVDLIANFYKEQRPELVPGLVDLANAFNDGTGKPFTEAEIRGYYREDALTWRVYLAFRKFDRWIHGMLRKPYPYILPGKIKR